MKIACILESAWGNGDTEYPLFFEPNPLNKSAKTIKKMVGENKFWFCNTTNEVGFCASDKKKPNDEHFLKVIDGLKDYDLILVCGRQAEGMVSKYFELIHGAGKPIVITPHPASRSLSNAQISTINKIIEEYKS